MTDRSVNVNPSPDQADCHIAVILGGCEARLPVKSSLQACGSHDLRCSAKNRHTRHRVSPSASPMTGSSGVSSTMRLLDSIAAVCGILDRPVKPGDDGWEYGAS